MHAKEKMRKLAYHYIKKNGPRIMQNKDVTIGEKEKRKGTN